MKPDFWAVPTLILFALILSGCQSQRWGSNSGYQQPQLQQPPQISYPNGQYPNGQYPNGQPVQTNDTYAVGSYDPNGGYSTQGYDNYGSQGADAYANAGGGYSNQGVNDQNINYNNGLSGDNGSYPQNPTIGGDGSSAQQGGGYANAPAGALDVVGVWQVQTSKDNCKLSFSRTPWGSPGSFRASGMQCVGDDMQMVKSWKLQGTNIILEGDGGLPVGSLRRIASNRFDGELTEDGFILMTR